MMKMNVTKMSIVWILCSIFGFADVSWYQMGATKARDIKGVNSSDVIVWVYRDGDWYCNREEVAEKLTTIQSGEGYWCLATDKQACQFTASGNGFVDFRRGWNLVTPRYNDWNLSRFFHLPSAWRYENGEWKHFSPRKDDKYPTTMTQIKKSEGVWLYFDRLDVTIAGMPVFCNAQQCLPMDVPSDNFYLKFKIDKKDYADVKIGFMIQRVGSDNLYRFAVGPFNLTKEGTLKDETISLCAASPSSKICRNGTSADYLSSDGEYVTLNGPAIAELFKKDKPDIEEKLAGVNGEYRFRIYTVNLPMEGAHSILNFGTIGSLSLGNQGIDMNVTFHEE